MGLAEYSNVGLRAPELRGGGPWLNSAPLSIREMRGRMVLIDFWTYTCVNCLRTLPFLKRWHEKYGDLGLVVVGVHTPEFPFEQSIANVQDFLRREGIRYPVVLDNDLRIWRAYTNRYWPTKYLVDARGVIRHHQVGEGGYATTERAIQRLLREAKPGLDLPPVEVEGDVEAQPGVCWPTTPEAYCGYYRGLLGNEAGYARDRVHAYDAPATCEDGLICLHGAWETAADYVRYAGEAADSQGYLELRYHAREVNVVARPRVAGRHRILVFHDGGPLAHAVAGLDVAYDAAGQSYLEVEAGRLYNVVRDDSFGSHLLRLVPLSEGVELYALTFGGCPRHGEPPTADKGEPTP